MESPALTVLRLWVSCCGWILLPHLSFSCPCRDVGGGGVGPCLHSKALFLYIDLIVRIVLVFFFLVVVLLFNGDGLNINLFALVITMVTNLLANEFDMIFDFAILIIVFILDTIFSKKMV